MIGVLGATGKTGSALCELLDQRGDPYVALSRRSEVRFDWTDQSTWGPALEGVTALYLVKPPHTPDMVDQVRRLLASASGLERVVLLSEAARNGENPSDNDRAIELIVEDAEVDSTILRPNWFFQTFSSDEHGYHGNVVEGLLPFQTGSAPIVWVDVRDVVEVARLALTEPGHAGVAHEISGPEAYGVDELARRLGEALGRRIDVAETASIETFSDLPADSTPRDLYFASLMVATFEGRFGNVTSTVKDVTGHEPRGFDDFIATYGNAWD